MFKNSRKGNSEENNELYIPIPKAVQSSSYRSCIEDAAKHQVLVTELSTNTCT